MREIFKEKYQEIFEPKLIEEVIKAGSYHKIRKNTIIMDIGDRVSYVPLLLSGTVKIMREDEDGNELLLYYLEVGDTCAMTLSSCVRKAKSKVKAVAESYSELITVPKFKMDEWVTLYDSWRVFMFESYNIRLHEMLESIDKLAFYNMKERIHKYLIEKSMVSKSTIVTVTHLQISCELNSSRAVISRLLKKLAKEGKVKLYRNKIEILSNCIH